MPHSLRKVRRQRGTRTHGWGQVGQHRKHGMKGGRGKAGLHKHKWTYTVKYSLNYFRRKGFICPTGQGQLKTINLHKLDDLVDRLAGEGKLPMEDGKYLADLSQLGYEKLLGGGQVRRPLRVKVGQFSRLAGEKIQASGGEVIKPER